MAVLKIYAEVDAQIDVPMEGVDGSTRDYDVQQHRPEVLEELQRRFRDAFGDDYRIVSFEFGLAGGEPEGNVPESGAR